jgi:hypothetical protein
MKTVKERDFFDLLELVCELHTRAINFPSKEMHDAYIEARREIEERQVQQSRLSRERVIELIHSFRNDILVEVQKGSVSDFTEKWIELNLPIAEVPAITDAEYRRVVKATHPKDNSKK